MDNSFKDMLLKSGNRVTQPRVALYRLLKEQSSPLSLAEINKRAKNIERTSIYRTLQLFRDLHIVTVIPFGWKQRYELAEPFMPHHHHLICESCGSLKEIGSEKIEKIVEAISNDEGFETLHHHFEIRGTCSKCLSAF